VSGSTLHKSVSYNYPRRFTGIEFAVVHAQPPSLFIIHKRERFSPEESKP
jgi:MED6 mediator sub complex component